MIGELYINLIPFVVVIISIIGVYYIFTKPIYALYIIIFTFPFKNFYIFYGTSFEIWKILSLVFIIFKYPQWITRGKLNMSYNKYYKILLIFIFFIFFSTAINFFILQINNPSQMEGGFLKNEGRIISQSIFFILTINLALLPFLIVKSFKQIITSIKVLLNSTVVLGFFGLVQFIVVKFTGLNPFPIKGSDGISHSGYLMDSMFRINSLAGEPKHMSIAMVIGITILLLCQLKKIRIIKFNSLLLLLLLFNLFFAFSTTGYVMLAASLLLIAIFNGLFNLKIIFSILAVIFILKINISDSEIESFDKQKNRAGFEVQDQSIIDYFSDEPIQIFFGKGLGNIHHYSVKYIPDDFPLFQTTPYKANSGIIYMISDYGFVGILLLFWLVSSLIYSDFKLYREKTNQNLVNQNQILSLLTLIIAVLFLFRYYELIFILVGLLIKKRNISTNTIISK